MRSELVANFLLFGSMLTCYSGVNYRLGDGSQEASRGFLNVALITLGLPHSHLLIYSTTFLECLLRTPGNEHVRQALTTWSVCSSASPAMSQCSQDSDMCIQ